MTWNPIYGFQVSECYLQPTTADPSSIASYSQLLFESLVIPVFSLTKKVQSYKKKSYF